MGRTGTAVPTIRFENDVRPALLVGGQPPAHLGRVWLLGLDKHRGMHLPPARFDVVRIDSRATFRSGCAGRPFAP